MIARADMGDMLARGFACGERLREGEAYFASILDQPPNNDAFSGDASGSEASSASGQARLAGSRLLR